MEIRERNIAVAIELFGSRFFLELHLLVRKEENLERGGKKRKRKKMVGDLLTKYGRQASQRGADKGDR